MSFTKRENENDRYRMVVEHGKWTVRGKTEQGMMAEHGMDRTGNDDRTRNDRLLLQSK
jgi:hypothetical protein